jgi:hypothetical protein
MRVDIATTRWRPTSEKSRRNWGKQVSEGRPESRRERWNDIKRTIFWVAVTVTIFAALAFVVVSLSAS